MSDIFSSEVHVSITYIDHVLALIALLGMRTRALWLLCDMDKVNAPRRPRQLHNLLGALWCADPISFENIEALSSGSLVDLVKCLWTTGAETPYAFLAGTTFTRG
jgi:hypothetical protein